MSDLQNRLTAALGRDINLTHEKTHNLVFELLSKVEHYQTEYRDTVDAIRNHLVKDGAK
jgi:hypothetical protein